MLPTAFPSFPLRRLLAGVLIGAVLFGTGGKVLAQTDLLAPPEEKNAHGMGWPSLSPDGKMLCFTYLGDLWTLPVAGGVASRLTVHEALDAYSRWSPDGKWIAFTSTRNGNADVFLVPAGGGQARQVTFHSANDWINDWSPDGTKLLFYSQRDTEKFALYSIDLKTHAVKRLSNDEEHLRFAAWSPAGETIAYTRAGQPWWRPWYRGSVAAQTVLEDVKTGKVKTLFKTPTQQFWPLFAPDGKSLFVTTIYGKGSNTPNLWRVPIGGSPQQITKYTTDAVRYPSIARNGSLLTYLWNGDLYTVKSDGTGAQKVNVLIRSDDKVNNQERLRLTQEADSIELAPDGKTIALGLRGDIWTIPVAGGDARRLTDSPSSDNDFSFSSDGNKLVFVSDRGNQPDIYLLDLKTKETTRLTNDPDAKSSPTFSPDGRLIIYAKAGSTPGVYIITAAGGPARRLAEGNGNNNFGTGINSFSWSSDNRWVAFSRMDRFQNRDIWVVPAIGGTAVNVTRYPGQNVNPIFTKDGRTLLFISDRTGPDMLFRLPLEVEEEEDKDDRKEGEKPKPKPDRSKDVKIDFDDIHLRAKQLSPPIGDVDDFQPTPDSQRVVVHIGGNFWVASITPGPAQQVTNGEPGGGIRISSDGSRFFYIGMGGTVRYLPLGGPGGPPGMMRTMAASGASPSVVPFTAELVFDRRANYQQAFNEFYRRFGASFYDAKLHGVDWKSLRTKYEPYLQGVGTPEEFAFLLSMMVGEVNSSHSEISPNSRGGGSQTATLGLFFDEGYTGPGLKVSSVIPKGPTDKASTRILPGEYVLSVDGKDVKLNEDYYQLLQDKAGKSLEVVVNTKPAKEGARTIKIKPIAFGEWINLEYEARVRRNRERVDKISNNRFAYIHIRNMDGPSLQRFLRELRGDAMSKDGLVLDIRGNGGGNTHDPILNALSRHVYGYNQPRDGLRQTQPEQAWTKPIVLLIDQNSYSDAEIFPAGFRALKLGKIVGVPTPGYVIGTYGGRLVDGTQIRLPSWGWYTADGKNMENLGIPPDITVENTPEDIAAGRDRQLETAVQTLLREVGPKPDTTAGAEEVGVRASANANPNGGSSSVTPGKVKPGSEKPLH